MAVEVRFQTATLIQLLMEDMFMKYDRYFLENVHNDIKADMEAIGLVPHYRNGNLLTLPQNSYDCDFCALRYWRKNEIILANVVSSPTFVARICIVPLSKIVPA